MKRIIRICLLWGVFINMVQAGDASNECKTFHIQVSNLTQHACVLISHRVFRGNLITPPPLSILSGDTKRFDMRQTVYGPTILLSFQCGPESISFISKQNACFLEAGSVTGELLPPLPINLNATYTALPGSYFWEKSGSINWKIIDLKTFSDS